MKKKEKAKSWLRKLLAMIIVILLSLMAVAYTVDPYLYYRMTDNKYMLNSRFVTKGIIENYEYDTVIIGSSMIQNFNMESFREKLDYHPIKATIGAMTVSEIELMHRLVKEKEQTERIITNIDMISYNSKEEENRFPDYLYDDKVLNDFKYLLGYETWMRFIPVDLAINLLYKTGIDLPDKFDRKTDIDLLEDSSKESVYNQDEVWKTYFNPALAVSKQDTTDMYRNMTDRFDEFLINIDIQDELDYIFLFPPYSALYWYEAEEREYKDQLIAFKKYIIEELTCYSNVRIIDMQDLNLIVDLNHYKDLTHFDPYIQELIIDAIKNKEFDVTLENMDDKINHLNVLVEFFIEKHIGLLEGGKASENLEDF